MQKVLLFLERYCQWLAIGLGVVFLGFMVYWYSPISPTPALVVTIKGEPVLPGRINETIDARASDLEKEMHEKHPGFVIKAPPVLDAWEKHNVLAQVDVNPLVSPFYFPGAIDSSSGPNPGAVQTGVKVTQLPDAPPADPATPVAVVTQRTVAIVPPPAPAGQPAGAQPAAGVDTDVDVVSTLFVIDHTKLAAAFNSAFGKLIPNLPLNIQTQINETMVLSVDLVREELAPDGKTWGNQTVIAPLTIHNMMALPPQKNPGQALVDAYMGWAQAHSTDILEPSYYETRKDMPVVYSPDQPPPTPTVDQPTPPLPPTVVQPPFPPTNRRPVPNNNGPTNPNNQPRRPGPAHGYGMLLDPAGAAPVIDAQYNPAQYNPAMMRPPGVGGAIPPWAQQPQAVTPNLNQPQGKFDVTKLTADIRILGHDDTVVPGRTYRYRVRYTLYNSIYDISNFANPAALAQQFYMISPLSQPTAQITIPTKLRFFLASIFRNGVVFDVFSWSNGKWTKKRSDTMYPGDAIPGTDWSVLDVREDLHGNGERYALLLKLDGTTERHEVKQDQEKPDYQELETQAAKSAQASAAPGQ